MRGTASRTISPPHRRLLALGRALLLICGALASGQLAAVDQNTQVRSYIEKLAKFVEWPKQAFASDQSHFNICVQGEEALNALASNLNQHSVGDRAIEVTALTRHPRGAGCQLVYITKSELWRARDILAEIGDRSVLTISDGGPFARTGGMIELVLENDRLAFEINLGQIERAGMKISSQVLKLAKNVYRE